MNNTLKLTILASSMVVALNANAAVLQLDLGVFDYTHGQYGATAYIPSESYTDLNNDGVVDALDGSPYPSETCPFGGSGCTLSLPATNGYTIGDEFSDLVSGTGVDGNTVTAQFDNMTFALTQAMGGSLNGDNGAGAGIYSAGINLLQLGASSFNINGSEGIADPAVTTTDNTLRINYNIPAMTFSIDFYDVDFSAGGSTDYADAQTVASGTITNWSNLAIDVAIDKMDYFAGFWLKDGNDFGADKTGALDSNVYNLRLQATGFTNVDVREVPEPSIVALLGLGLFGMGMVARRKKQA